MAQNIVRKGLKIMSDIKLQAVESLNRLAQNGVIDYSDYSLIYDGLAEIPSLEEQDHELEELWSQFEDIPMDPLTECIEDPFLDWPAGTHREEIWTWFDKRHSRGVYYLLHGLNRTRAKNEVPESTKKLWGRYGITMNLTAAELATVAAGGEAAFDFIRSKVTRGEFSLDGETYFPAKVSCLPNEWPLTEDISFEL